MQYIYKIVYHRRATAIAIRRPNTAIIVLFPWCNPNGSKLPMPCAQGARIGLGPAAAMFHVNATGDAPPLCPEDEERR